MCCNLFVWIPEEDNPTERFRKPFFISWKAAHKTVSKDTKLGLEKTGIDMSTFHPNRTRAVSTSKAVEKVSLKTVLRTAHWRRANTFTTFYHKPMSSGKRFGEAVWSWLSHSFRSEVANVAVFNVSQYSFLMECWEMKVTNLNEFTLFSTVYL